MTIFRFRAPHPGARPVSSSRRAPGALISALFIVSVLLGLAAAVSLRNAALARSRSLQRQVEQLGDRVQQLQQEQRMPAELLNESRGSVGYIYGEYSFARLADRHSTRFSGTGFVIGPGLIATNRHVAQPWFDDDYAQALIAHGAVPRLTRLIIFFPGVRQPVTLFGPLYSRTEDLAVLHFDPRRVPRRLKPLPIATAPAVPGDAVVLVGYPMGLAAMVAKSPTPVYRRLAYRNRDADTARELAQLSLIRPSATVGHIGDVVDNKIIYDAVTAQGGSGGPVFNLRGEVIGVNSAYLDGFSGSTLGLSVAGLRPLLQTAQRPLLTTSSPLLTNAISKQK